MAKTTIQDDTTLTHSVKVSVTENVKHRMYLREEIGHGTTDDGQKIEICTTGPHLIISLGEFTKGRQFVVSVSDIASAVIEQLTNHGPRKE